MRVSLICLSSLLLLAGCDTGSEPENQSESDTAKIAKGEGAPILPGQIMRNMAGTQLPQDLTFTNPDGQTLAIADLKGTPILLNLWATWCVPCRKEMPLLDNLADELGDDVRVLTVSQDTEDAQPKVVEFFDEGGFRNLEQWLDPENELARAFSDAGLLPVTILFDAKGREILRVAGGYEWDSEEAIALVSEALEEADSAS